MGEYMIENKLIIRGGEQGKYDVIVFLKGFAITTIVLMHLIQEYLQGCSGVLVKAAAIGGTGVHVFFFCSGFGLYLSYTKKPTTYRGFLIRRFGKIYFPYIFIVAISALFPFMYKGDHLHAFFSHVFLYKMFMPQYETSFGNQLWYISTIIQFYFVFIALCKLKQKVKNKCFFTIALLVSVFWWIFTGFTGLNEIRIWGSFFLQYLWEFALGMLAAERLEERKDISCDRLKLSLISLVGICIATVAALKGGAWTTFNDIFAMFGYLALALLIYSCKIEPLHQLMIFMSEISYELYLIHILVFKVLFTLTGVSGKETYLMGCVALWIVILTAYAYHTIICKVECMMKGEKIHAR